ncbi:MAG: hypothetical protein WBG50_09015 [Desulfomonilaceae bacterium]
MRICRRCGRHGHGLAVIIVMLAVLSPWMPVHADFVSNNWKKFRDIHVPQDLPDGLAGVFLEPTVIDRCRPDLGDLRVVSSKGMSVLVTVTHPASGDAARPFPAQIFRVARTAGKWTDISIDKTGKILTSGILVGTRSKNFVRRVEIRGSDNVRDAYVIRMDGLIASLPGPVPFKSLKLVHPLNNFQYMYLRIMDGDQPPLKIDSIQCCPPPAHSPLSRPLDVRILENRTQTASGSTRIIADLGEKRFSITQVGFSTPAKDFVKRIRLKGASQLAPEAWKKIYEGTVFRLRKDDATSEVLKVRTNPGLFRYISMELYGGGRTSVPIEKLEVSGTMRMAIFEYHRGLEYKLFYDNPSAEGAKSNPAETPPNVAKIVSTSSNVRLGPERENSIVQAQPDIHTKKKAGLAFWRLLGVVMVAVGLLLMFSLTLRTRSLKKSFRGRNSRIVNTRS